MSLLYEPVKKVSRIHLTLQKCLSASTSIFELLATHPTINNEKDALPLMKCTGHIVLKDLTFHYGIKNATPALHEINLTIQPGQKIALVGASGAGKSTILALLLRFYDPQEGAVLIDGHDVRSLQLDSLREQIGVVTQENFLFHDTIYENIRFGRLDATQVEIEEAARQAFAHDFILAQPKGYETIVGDKGCLLSGGQQQRLAIARALLKGAPILLLDEATSALDSESERMIQMALQRLEEGRTVIAIAHRLSTVLASDVIVVMDQGCIAAIGTHRELLSSSEIYRKLYELQFHHAA
jgi:subfamily B ATP-binding cassette protein MsbA